MSAKTLIDCETKTSLMDVYLLLGRILFHNGATVKRIQQSIAYLHKYFGEDQLHVLVEYDAIIITDINGDKFETKVDRAHGFSSVNIEAIVNVSKLLSSLEQQTVSAALVAEKLRKIDAPKTGSQLVNHVVFALAGVLFGLLNRGDWWFIAVVFPAALVVSVCKTALVERHFNLYVSTLVAATTGMLTACALISFVPTQTALLALISPLLPLVPGLPLINGGTDILRNHNSVGLARMAFAAMMVGVLVAAVCLPVALFPQLIAKTQLVIHSNGYYLVQDLILGGIGAVVIAKIFDAPKNLFLLFALGGALARGVRAVLLLYCGADNVTAAFCGALSVTILGYFLVKNSRLPISIYGVVCSVMLIPGFLLIAGLKDCFLLARLPVEAITLEFIAHTAQTLVRAFLIVAAILGGVMFPALLLDGRKPRI
ncbi:MAG: threonine/serine exporter family protein [Negativicutes bacterium]|jgi:uncharacterized membrane protein YjjP (DUF1212 family)